MRALLLLLILLLAAPAWAAQQFIWPVDGWVTATDVYPHGGGHGTGTAKGFADIACQYWTRVTAARGGTVSNVAKLTDTLGSGAWMVTVDHESNYQTVYGHLIERPAVSIGQVIVAGQTVGYSGRTGIASTPHVHFGILLSEVGVASTVTFGDWSTRGDFIPGDFAPLSAISEVVSTAVVKTVVKQDAYDTASAGGTVTCTLDAGTVLTRADSSVGFYQAAACATNVWVPYSSVVPLQRGEGGDTGPALSENPIGGPAVNQFTAGRVRTVRTTVPVPITIPGGASAGYTVPSDSILTVYEDHPNGTSRVTDPRFPFTIGADLVGVFYAWAPTSSLGSTENFLASVSASGVVVRDAPSVAGNAVFTYDVSKPTPGGTASVVEVSGVVNGWYQVVSLNYRFEPFAPDRAPVNPPRIGTAWIPGWQVVMR